MSNDGQRLFSSQWHRVAGLTPRLRPHAKIERQTFGGQVWYTVLDPASGRSHRLSPAVHYIVASMDGEEKLENLWLRAHERLGDEAPGQDDVIQILGQLHGADILICELPPDFREVVSRGRAARRRQTIARFKNPLGIRIPLIDPDKFLDRTVSFAGPLFSPAGFIVWLAVVLYGAVLAAMHYRELTADFADRVLAADNLFILWLTFPVVKALHELGHAYAVKKWGGEVHEIGVMFLVFVPVPYVDATGASGFREKWKRAVVGAAGIMVELPVAVLALVIWLEAEPGFIRAVAYNTMLIAGVSTLLFNGNPLLRYDGYYVLTDIAEMPNLGTRANKYLTYLIQKHLLRARNTANPIDRPDERWKLVAYALLSFIYRMAIWVGIIMLVASKFFFIGAVLAFWAAWLMIGWPLVKAARYLASSSSLSGKRARAIAIAGGVLASFAVVLGVLPAPLATVVEGVIWTPERTELRAGRSGVVSDVFARTGDQVAPGDAILAIEDPLAIAEAEVARLKRKEIEAKFRSALSVDAYAAELITAELEEAQNRVEHAERKVSQLTVHAGAAGRLISVASADDLPGRYVERGDLVGYVKGDDGLVVRAIVAENEIALVRARARNAKLRIVTRPGRVHEASITRIGPSPTRALPNMALSKEGGGRQSLDPASRERALALEPVYEFEMRATGINDEELIGARAYVRIDLGTEPIAWQVFRRARQVFLERLSV